MPVISAFFITARSLCRFARLWEANEPGSRRGARGEEFALGGEQPCDAALAEGQHGAQLLLAESALFAGALELHEVAIPGHDEVQIDARLFVLQVVQI